MLWVRTARKFPSASSASSATLVEVAAIGVEEEGLAALAAPFDRAAEPARRPHDQDVFAIDEVLACRSRRRRRGRSRAPASSATPNTPHSARFWIRMPWPPARKRVLPLAASYRPTRGGRLERQPGDAIVADAPCASRGRRAANAASTAALSPRSPSQHRLSGASSQIVGAPGASASATLDDGGQRLVVDPHQLGGLDRGGTRVGDRSSPRLRRRGAPCRRRADSPAARPTGAPLAMGERHVARAASWGSALARRRRSRARSAPRARPGAASAAACIDRCGSPRAHAASAACTHEAWPCNVDVVGKLAAAGDEAKVFLAAKPVGRFRTVWSLVLSNSSRHRRASRHRGESCPAIPMVGGPCRLSGWPAQGRP